MTTKIDPVWYELAHMSELTEYLQSIPSHELTKRVATEVSEENLAKNPRRLVIEEFIRTTKDFLADLSLEIEPDLAKHSLNYPFVQVRIPFVVYESTPGRETYQKVQSFLRKIPGVRSKFMPRKIQSSNIPIILPGVDYSAESLLGSLSLADGVLPDKSRLGWQHLDAYADYCLGVMALGRETYSSLMEAWYFEEETDAYFSGLETLSEEMLHHISDEIAGPRYSSRSIDREHYWMKSYGDFPEKIDIALLRLKDDYVGRLKRSLAKTTLNNLQAREIERG